MKPTRRLTPTENAKVIVLKRASPSFVILRKLAMRFRSILRGKNLISSMTGFMTRSIPGCA
ncbi:hypothetical protein [Methylocystis heyeri]|uniref:Uncharacterized protein n=1 Tax=Methylocystis heyeri TaxID=391905 RepID=A0A6B8KID5_9HYPH|nr:hypothetical protein [Methylocystis heyeri]QGM46801.1 hypothetical protein H2LOC_014465 [Methylocystis heyeri]